MFIKKFSNAEKSSKICRTPSEELQEELLKETINYPETISSPEPQINSKLNFDTSVANSTPVVTVPNSPRPRAVDIEPARVLKYSSNDTEIWWLTENCIFGIFRYCSVMIASLKMEAFTEV